MLISRKRFFQRKTNRKSCVSCRMAPMSMTLNNLKSHSLVVDLFKCNRWKICAAFYTISTDSVLARFLYVSRSSCRGEAIACLPDCMLSNDVDVPMGKYFRDSASTSDRLWTGSMSTCMKVTSRHYWATTEPAKPQPCSCWLVRADVSCRNYSLTDYSAYFMNDFCGVPVGSPKPVAKYS